MAIFSIRSNTPLAHAMVEPMVDRPLIGRQSRCFITRISKESQYISDFILFFQMLIKIGLSGPLLRKAKLKIRWRRRRTPLVYLFATESLG